MTTKISLVATPEAAVAAVRTHWQSLGLGVALIDALETGLSLNGTLAYARAGNVELFGHTNDVPQLVDLYVPDDDADLWRAPLASAATMTVQATRGELTLPAMEGAAIARPLTPRYVLAGFALPVELPNGDSPTPGVWVQPLGAHDAYSLGAIVKWGNRWVSLIPGNPHEPGISSWREVVPEGAIPAWVQPTGAHDAYPMGARVTHNGRIWESLNSANVWEPSAAVPTLWADEGPV